VLTKRPVKDEHFGFDFSDCPDLAQTAAVTVSGLGIPSLFNGLHTLRIKETDRIIALQNELAKINVKVTEHSGSLSLEPSSFSGEPEFSTYNDHRMAMAFAALAIKYPGVTIDAPEVVKKSYPGFWDDLRKLGFEIRETE
jgi:3-phosphoshikimate 1-carboxyvinyltransferase